MPLALAPDLSFGFITVMANTAMCRATVALAERLDYDSIWVGDHVEFPVPILDPLLQIAQAAGMSETLTFGTGVYLLPMRHVVHVAKQLTSLDQLTGGRLIFGTGIGGEFPNEWAATGVPHNERGARMSEAIPVLKQLLSGATCTNTGRFYPFENVTMKPACTTPRGPPIWTGGRSAPALKRAGEMADGWFSYVVTPAMYRDALQDIETAAGAAQRSIDSFGSGHLLFMRVDDSYEQALDHATEHLSTRYAMDFREAAKKYAALGSPADVAERVNEYAEAGCRHFVLDLTGPFQDRDEQIERFAREVKPLLGQG
jgi:alkanesulfonate monooxygenase SsuD/methylene tetrahydromethanopterin reductase-like flavin-dependent oxidoreductase (luciferase family)